jgi:uncharacterized membrane protein
LPAFVAYLLSFLVIGWFWNAHRGFSKYIHAADSRVVWASLAVLLWVTLVLAASDPALLAEL